MAPKANQRYVRQCREMMTKTLADHQVDIDHPVILKSWIQELDRTLDKLKAEYAALETTQGIDESSFETFEAVEGGSESESESECVIGDAIAPEGTKNKSGKK